MIIAVSMQKGGVGKTTTTLALGSELARAGARVLLIDLDPQASLTEGIGVTPDQLDGTIYEAMLDPANAAQATIHLGNRELLTGNSTSRARDLYPVPCGLWPPIDLIPATLNLAGAELSFAGRFGRELLLRQALAPLRSLYDYILIDSPPGLGIFTVNALVAADRLLIPLQAHVFAMDQMAQMESTITMIRQMNPGLSIGGIVVTMVGRTNINQAIESAARQRYGDLVFETTIPHSVKIIEAPAAGKPITIYAPESSGALAYAALAEEVRGRWPLQGGRNAA